MNEAVRKFMLHVTEFEDGDVTLEFDKYGDKALNVLCDSRADAGAALVEYMRITDATHPKEV